MSVLFDILNSINFKKTEFSKEEIDREYPAFVVNRGLSFFMDTVLFANEMNMHPETPGYGQYLFYFHALRPKKRFSKWHKKSKLENIDVVKEFYGYGDQKAEEALAILTDDQLDVIRDRLYKGGKAK